MALAALRRFDGYARKWFTVASKAGGFAKLDLRPAQAIIDHAWTEQQDDQGCVRLNILKCRQCGATTYCRARATHWSMTHTAATCLTIAHEQRLPEQWLAQCRELVAGVPEGMRPGLMTAQGYQLKWDNGSRYYIGSAGGGFPGVGDTINFLHLSELGRWDKSPVSVDPDAVLLPLQPAIPSGLNRAGTVIIRESTGVVRGDYWWRTWTAGRRGEDGFHNVFLPWFLVPEYRRDDLAGEVLEPSQRERDIEAAGRVHGVTIDKAQLAWRRAEIRGSPWNGREDAWAAEFPATEEEAFLPAGASVYTAEHIRQARLSVRVPRWRGNLLTEGVAGSPYPARVDANESGEMLIWEWPNEKLHYVIGADCQWGDSKTADFDVAYVECLETSKLCAKIRGRFPLSEWGRKLARFGCLYNYAPLAPERNAKSADALMPLLLGKVAEWSYPNVWIRVDDVALKGHRPQDYGWLTTTHTKGQLVQFSQTATVDGSFDWCDGEAVDQAESIVLREDLSMGAPAGAHDDDWMARLITGYVAHRQRSRTDLYRYEARPPISAAFRTLEQRITEMVQTKPDDDGDEGE